MSCCPYALNAENKAEHDNLTALCSICPSFDGINTDEYSIEELTDIENRWECLGLPFEPA